MVRLRCFAWLVLSLALKLAFTESKDSHANVTINIDVGTPYRKGSERFVDYTCNLPRATNVNCTHKIQGSQAGYLGYLGCCFKQREDNSTTVAKIECNTEPESRDCTDSSYTIYKENVPLTPRKDSSKIASSTETTLKTSYPEPEVSHDNGEVRIAPGKPHEQDWRRLMDYTCYEINGDAKVLCTHEIGDDIHDGEIGFLGCCYKTRQGDDSTVTVDEIECNTEPESRNCTDSSYTLYKAYVRRKEKQEKASSTQIAVTVGVTVAIFTLVALCIYCCASSTIAEKEQSEFRKFRPNAVMYS